MARVYLSLGSNLGDRPAHLAEALRQLRTLEPIRVVTCSRIYETEPWPEATVPRERWYLNCAVEIETGLDPLQILQLLQGIENTCGRVRPAGPPAGADQPAYADRTLDIDILLYEDHVVADHELMIPHPLLHERRFVLAPLAEIAPEVEHPVLYQPIRELLAELVDDRGLHLYPD